MNETEIQRLLLASTVRQLAVMLQAAAKNDALQRFVEENPRPSSTPGRMYRPTIEDRAEATKQWVENNPLDNFIPKALEELRRINSLIDGQ